MRNVRGESLVGLLVALSVLAAIFAFTPLVVQTRLMPLQSASRYTFSGFVAHFNRLASHQAAANWANPSFRASSLAGTYPLAEGSAQTATVSFEGCLDPAVAGLHNNLPPSQSEALAAQITRQTPAQVITSGDGQTGGVILNEPYDRRLPEVTQLLRYKLTGPAISDGNPPPVAISQIPASPEQCQ